MTQPTTALSTIELLRLFNPPSSKPLISSLQRNLEPGWLMPFLFENDHFTWKRWDYWLRTTEANQLLEEPIPQIEFLDTMPNNPARENFEACLSCIPAQGRWQGLAAHTYFDYLLDWLLFGFGHEEFQKLPAEPSGCEGASMRLYQTFNLGLHLLYPMDNLGNIMQENGFGKAGGFYPTPPGVVRTMVEIMYFDVEQSGEDVRVFLQEDCCVGSGRMLLYGSNYTLNLAGQDNNRTCVKATLVNGYLFAPWMVKPFRFLTKTNQPG